MCYSIPAGIPADLAVAHKTGNLTAMCIADVGIVFAPTCDYILCNDPVTDSGATDEIVKLSRMVYAFFAGSSG